MKMINCSFNLCEFYNVVFGGIITGVVASFLFVWLTKSIEIIEFKRKYNHLKSPKKESFDWIAYNFTIKDGRIREETPNGSTVNICLQKNRICISLRQNDEKNRRWNGILSMDSFSSGIVTLKYEGEHEYGKRNCVIGTFEENEKTYDYLFLIPITNKIFRLEKCADGKFMAVYDYGNEIFIREQSSKK